MHRIDSGIVDSTVLRSATKIEREKWHCLSLLRALTPIFVCDHHLLAGIMEHGMSMGNLADAVVNRKEEERFGKADPSRETVRNARRVIVKVPVFGIICKIWSAGSLIT
jgi:hypothetical protein